MRLIRLPAGATVRSSFVLFFLTLTLLALWLAAPAVGNAQDGPEPATTPDAEIGLELFEERCANCHGPLGGGDGELTPQLPAQPAALNNTNFSRQLVPAEVFATITEGIAASGMPPFGPASSNPISEEGRWHLVAAVLSFGTPGDALAEGETVYAETCTACHGEAGTEEIDLTGYDYWLNRSNADVFAALRDKTAIPEHEEFNLEDEALWSTIAYARTFSYDYANPLARFSPIESITVTGVVENGTTGERLEEGVPVVLNAFTADFAPSETTTTTLNAEGEYTFTRTMVPPGLVYVVSVEYEELNYSSDFARTERSEPLLELPVTVYDKSSDPAGVSINQLHVILEFTPESVTVSELYQFSQAEQAVYVGPAGEAAAGTVEITLPERASDPAFSRTFGSMESFFPADNVIPTDRGWADTIPVRPGEDTLNLLVAYTLPYESGMELSHPVFYNVERANVVIADGGVTLQSDAGWSEEVGGAMGGMFPSYTREDIGADETIAFKLQGVPEPISLPGSDPEAAPAASAPVERNRTTEMLIGGGVLLLAIAIGLILVRNWQQSVVLAPAAEDEIVLDREMLLQEIADLDDAYEAGELEESDYQRERAALKEMLLEIWE